MEDLFVGDRVRLLHASDEGIIVRFLDNDIVEVAIDADFAIPVVRKELVRVSERESTMDIGNQGTRTAAKGSFSSKNPQQKPSQNSGANDSRAPIPRMGQVPPASKPVLASVGIFIAAQIGAGGLCTLHLVNNTDLDLVFTLLGEGQRGAPHDDRRGLAQGIVKSQQTVEVYRHNVDYLEEWPILHFSILYTSSVHHINPGPLYKSFHFKEKDFAKQAAALPLIAGEGHVFQVDGKAEAKTPKRIITRPEPHQNVLREIPKIQNVKSIVDLHAEALPNAVGAKPAALLELQVAEFEKQLDLAIAHNLNIITFIHGVGKGELKNRIQKALSQREEVSTFKDAMRERFGYGATEVHLK